MVVAINITVCRADYERATMASYSSIEEKERMREGVPARAQVVWRAFWMARQPTHSARAEKNACESSGGFLKRVLSLAEERLLYKYLERELVLLLLLHSMDASWKKGREASKQARTKGPNKRIQIKETQ